MGHFLLFKYLLYVINFIYNQGRVQDFKLMGQEYKEKKNPNSHPYSIKKL